MFNKKIYFLYLLIISISKDNERCDKYTSLNLNVNYFKFKYE